MSDEKSYEGTAALMAAFVTALFIGAMVQGCNDERQKKSALEACQRQGFSYGHFEPKYGYVCESWQPMPTPRVSDK